VCNMKEWSITHVAGFNGDYKAVQKVSSQIW
jgi:hypothetical protein